FVVSVVSLPRGFLPAVADWLSTIARRHPYATPEPKFGAEVNRSTLTLHPDQRTFSIDQVPDVTIAATPNYAVTHKPSTTLELRQVGKWYGSFPALRDVTLSVTQGELVSIVGPNGAGKTSLLRCVSDGVERTGGDVLVSGVSIGTLPPDKIV